ncbi:hypothetical protein T440DRAFT_405353 [Plenodomus tracheiphilus IPT5]|uniref:Uncharacterized protein n=1 Tax=Plenodomus tracheiphilus IPT5 TaxID=1408161 RepID=A0A6A7AU65_9PLEO|nr:hypothetical protein T440DRAFT_405353 [Plenodomus tracheiphilus IPT5]
MHAFKLLMTLFITAIIAQTFTPTETGMAQPFTKDCEKSCYNTIRYLMGVRLRPSNHTHKSQANNTIRITIQTKTG